MLARAKTLLLLLAACCLPAFAHVPRASLVVQKPHQGVERFAQDPHRGPGAANALNATGLSSCLCDEGVRSRSTAKERDTESNLDYFLARYYGSSLGRFTSPDAPLVDQFRTAPQSWNLYSYVRNNPLRLRDPTGRCSEDGNGGYTDEGEGLFPGRCSEGKIGGDEGAEVTVYAYPQLDPLVAQALRSAGYRAERDIKTFAVTSVAAGSAVGGGFALSTSARLTQLGIAGAPALPLIPRLGNKLNYLFGQAPGGIQRSITMLNQLRRIGLQDTPQTRAYVRTHLQTVLNDASAIVRTQADGRVVRESLLMGPRGGVKVESIWEGTKLITVNLLGKGQ